MKEKKYCVYQHTNKVNGKVYIGMTGLKPNSRWRNGHGYNNQPELWEDIQAYGWKDGFAHEIIFDGLTKEEARVKEAELIDEYLTINPSIVYNKACNYALLDKEKKAQPLTGVIRSVYCIELDETYPSAAEAGRALGINNSHISACCRGDRKTTGGYHFEYKEFTDEPVYCEETKKFYGSASLAAKELGLNGALVKRVCKGTLQTTGKKHFRFATIEEKNLLQNC